MKMGYPGFLGCLRLMHLGRLGLLGGPVGGGRLGGRGLRRRTVAPLDQTVVDLFHRHPGRLALAGLDLGPGTPHELLGTVGRDEDATELAVNGRPFVIHLSTNLLGDIGRYGGTGRHRAAAKILGLREYTLLLEVFEDPLDPAEHPLSPMPLLQDDTGQGLAGLPGIVIDDNILILIVTRHLP
jgi:hypothetical protein